MDTLPVHPDPNDFTSIEVVSIDGTVPEEKWKAVVSETGWKPGAKNVKSKAFRDKIRENGWTALTIFNLAGYTEAVEKHLNELKGMLK